MRGGDIGHYESIYAVVRRVPRGKVLSYGRVAELAGLGNHARQVGYALHALPESTDVPWHRVVNAQGKIALRRGSEGGSLQRALLESEAVPFTQGRIDMRRYGWKPARCGAARRDQKSQQEARVARSSKSAQPPKSSRSKRRSFWLVKSEPVKYSWDDFNKDGRTYWDGVRNYTARNNLQGMKKGDWVLYYHSNEGKEVVGIAEVEKEAYPDPTTDDDRWVVVDVIPVAPLETPVSLAKIKADPALQEMVLVRQSRLSVMPVSAAEFTRVLKLGKTARPR
jgi:predicted RNA-binding protein with PUA-like domain/alkylated DNA nucleotide flippase Atl1